MVADHPSDPARTGSLFADEASAHAGVGAAVPDEALKRLAVQLPAHLRLGTSSWHFPGWANRVWDRLYSEKQLSRAGLSAYARHPLFGAVSLDRAFYRPLSVAQYAAYADQVPEGFRFLVKAPASVCDAWLRSADGAGRLPNAAFLDAEIAIRDFIVPATSGLGQRCGPLLFQLSPLQSVADDGPAFLARLDAFLAALPPLDRALTPHACYAVEIRDPALLTPRYIRLLRERGVRFCLAARDRLPPVPRQAPKALP